MMMMIMHSVCIFVFIVDIYFVSTALGKSLLLGRSDISAGNSLSVPQLTAVCCHYHVFLLTSLPFLKLIDLIGIQCSDGLQTDGTSFPFCIRYN